jgi:geranylgeranyl diphosphate synthase type II
VKVKKATYPALYGIDASRQKARAMVDTALEDIRNFGEEANFLRGLAQFVVNRTA